MPATLLQPPLLIAALAALTASSVLLTLAWPYLSRSDALARRVSLVERQFAAEAGDAEAARSAAGAAQRKSVRAVLGEVEEVRRARSRRVLIRRLREAGLQWGKRRYYTVVAGLGLAGALFALLAGLGALMTAAFGLILGLGVPNLMLSTLRRRRIKAFSSEFPNAIDVIVRGVRSGLPTIDCFHTIAEEAREPLRSEFGKVISDVNAGLPLGDAVQRFAVRVPVSEASFFAIVIAIQTRTGGNLTGSLQNLSTVLRERQKMRAKVRSYSSEAKASAAIIGSLPIVVGFIVFITSPDYISVLFTTPMGKLVLVACGVWMGMGILMMRKMINFDF